MGSAMQSEDEVLVTGGTGFFGRALLRSLVQRERSGQALARVTVLTRSPAAFVRAHPEFTGLHWLHLHQGDICDAASLPRQRRFSHVLHAATDSTLGPRLSPLQRFDQIVNGTRNLLELAVQCQATRFLHTSSGAVYGMQPPELEHIPEDRHSLPDPLQGANAYGLAKRTAEHLGALYGAATGLQVVHARCFAFVGRDLPLEVHFAIGNFVRDALWGECITVQGDGSPQRSYMDQRDLARWLLALLYAGRAGQAYNVGSDQAISMAELATLVRDVLAPDKSVRILGQATGSATRNRYVPSIHKAQQDLGLTLHVALGEAIRDMAQALRQQKQEAPHAAIQDADL